MGVWRALCNLTPVEHADLGQRERLPFPADAGVGDDADDDGVVASLDDVGHAALEPGWDVNEDGRAGLLRLILIAVQPVALDRRGLEEGEGDVLLSRLEDADRARAGAGLAGGDGV